MTRVRVESFTVSLDGYAAGPNQDLECVSSTASEKATHVMLRRSSRTHR